MSKIGINKFSTAAAIEDLITPPVQINYTKHLINGQFVDAASGIHFLHQTTISHLNSFSFSTILLVKVYNPIPNLRAYENSGIGL